MQQTFKIEPAHARGGGIWEELGVRFMRLLHVLSLTERCEAPSLLTSVVRHPVQPELEGGCEIESDTRIQVQSRVPQVPNLYTSFA